MQLLIGHGQVPTIMPEASFICCKLRYCKLTLSVNIVNDITNFCFRFLPKPYTGAFAGPKTKFLMSLTIVTNFFYNLFYVLDKGVGLWYDKQDVTKS